MVRGVASRTSATPLRRWDDGGDRHWPRAVYAEGLKLIEAGANPMGLKRGIDRATAALVGDCVSRAKDASVTSASATSPRDQRATATPWSPRLHRRGHAEGPRMA